MITLVRSPIGELRLAATDEGLAICGFRDEGLEDPRLSDGERAREHLRAAERWLARFFEGAMGEPLPPLDAAGTALERGVWAALCAIPVGETISYGAIARAVGRPGAARAVGAANGKNPIAVLVPCHRVIGSDGKMVGYGGGLDRKRWLLDHERRHAGRQRELTLR